MRTCTRLNQTKKRIIEFFSHKFRLRWTKRFTHSQYQSDRRQCVILYGVTCDTQAYSDALWWWHSQQTYSLWPNESSIDFNLMSFRWCYWPWNRIIFNWLQFTQCQTERRNSKLWFMQINLWQSILATITKETLINTIDHRDHRQFSWFLVNRYCIVPAYIFPAIGRFENIRLPYHLWRYFAVTLWRLALLQSPLSCFFRCVVGCIGERQKNGKCPNA